MNNKTLQKQLFFEYLPLNSPTSLISSFFSQKKSDELNHRNISTIFIITSNVVDSENYIKLVRHFRESGFKVHTIYIESIDISQLESIKTIVEQIENSFQKGNCYVLSYGWSYAPTIITCFYIYTGKSLQQSSAIIENIRNRLMKPDEDTSFLNAFNDYISFKDEMTAIKVPDKAVEKTKIPEKIKDDELKISDKIDKISVSKTEEKPVEIKKEKKKKVKESKPLSDEEYLQISKEFIQKAHTGPFYQSLKFKLISIISSIIIVSMSGMIFIATHFFRSDNEVRVQESNLKFSEIIASKVQSELDKSIVIASTMLRDFASSNTDNEFTEFNESDVLFSGLIDTNGLSSLKFKKKYYNSPVMTRYLVPKDKLDLLNSKSIESFKRAFNGETVIQNVSQGLDSPVMLLTLPYKVIRNAPISNILIIYLKLDTLLKAFQTTGIITSFMVNDKGDIIAHPDSSIVLSGGNLAGLPIVDRMLKSNIDNSQTRYKDDKNIYYLASFKKINMGGCGIVATAKEEVAFQEVYNIQRRNIYLMVIMLSTAILIVFFFGRSITSPIIRLVAATQQIIKGNYHINIKPTSRDEIGELTYSFIEMGKGLEEREKIKSAFGKFVNKEIAEAAMRDELRLGGDRKDVAIFFSDIRDFTSISEQLEPEEVVEFLNQYMTRMVQCVEQFKGLVDKFIGDAIMATWGSVVTTGNDTENAINSALLMRKVLTEFNEDRGTREKPLIKIGCGINTGPVLAGQIGSEDRMEYTVIGDAVNLASRIEALNKPFGTDILISEDSYNLVKDIYAFEKMQTIKVKGKENPQQIYAVLGRLDDPARIKSIEQLRDLLGMKPLAFNRRSTDRDVIDQPEKKYEIINE